MASSSVTPSALHDPVRLAALARTGLFGTPPEPRFDRLTRLAARLLGAPVAMISLVDDRHQFLKACVGAPMPFSGTRTMPLRHSLCRLVVEASAPLSIGDARVHPLVRDHDAVGELGVVAYLGTPLLGPDGQTIGTLCVIDIVARNWSERDLGILDAVAEEVSTEIAAGGDTAAMVRASPREGADTGLATGFAADVLSQQAEAVGRMASGVAHDVNNILAAVSGYADLIRTSANVDEESRRDAGEIVAAIDRGRRLTAQLLGFSRHESRALAPLQLADVVRDAITALRPSLGDAVRIRLVLADRLPGVAADRRQMDQLVTNVLANAGDAMPGGGEIVIETSALPSDGRTDVCLTIRDSGSGMDDATRARIFEPFFTTRRAEGRTGLGLAIVEHVVVQSHGRIEVQSAAARGSTFRIFLPALRN